LPGAEDQIEATFADGVLEVKTPKPAAAEQPEPKSIMIV
jgi:HSP20 family molecular chaperone IbpA